MNKLRVLDLFSGIGGFSLGLERTGGFETVAFCEIEDFPRRVLAKHWPDVPCYRDVRELTAERLAADGIAIDVICGGFPCQDISVAGHGAGLAGARSGLWSEIARLVGELAPRYVIVENVSALLSRGLGTVLGDLATLGYDADWDCIPASAVGALHYRDRFWMVAHPMHDGYRADDAVGENSGAAGQGEVGRHQWQRLRPVAGGSGEDLADPECGQGIVRHEPAMQRGWTEQAEQAGLGGSDVPDAHDAGCLKQRWPVAIRTQLAATQRRGWWISEPDVGRVAHGVPSRVDRLRCLGNAVVPQIPELIGNAILDAIGWREAA